MPKTEEILNGLKKIVDTYSTYAIIWHTLFYLLLGALLLKWHPSNKLGGLAICVPVISVAVFAWLTGNPFNGTLFSVLAVMIIIFGISASNQDVQTSQLVFIVIGIIMIVFGLIYPHFVNTDSFLKYLYASPVGLIPCPTLSIIVGFLLVYNGFGSNPITLILIVYGLFYGLFGVLKLSVNLDIFLVFGTVTLLLKYLLSLRS